MLKVELLVQIKMSLIYNYKKKKKRKLGNSINKLWKHKAFFKKFYNKNYFSVLSLK